jgi:hypothetical protein
MKQKNEFDINHYQFLCRVYEEEVKNDQKNHQAAEHCLNLLRKYLDKCGFKMPKPKYRFILENVITHKYLPSETEKTVNFKIKEILNPAFRVNGDA